MQVTPTTFTVADYCTAMKSGEIFPNKEYQRSDQVWPAAARSYLIDTILSGYPIPKLSLAQKTDLKSRKTFKEIVDGQQRSQAILDFFEGHLRLTSKSEFSGKKYGTLDEEYQQRFLEYPLSVDLFVGATPPDIREVFRRINSYTVPLNPQEQRHARFQGVFKWFVVEQTQKYAQVLVDIGVFKENQISRMADAQFFTEVSMSFVEGISTYSKAKLDKFYEKHDDSFPQESQLQTAFRDAFGDVIAMKSLHGTSMMKASNFFTLLIAILHCRNRIPMLNSVYEFGQKTKVEIHDAEVQLTALAEAINSEVPLKKFVRFVDASGEGNNTITKRSERFKWCCRALDSENR
jgi:hypothetical protein